MWRVLGSPPRIDLVELGPGRGLFAQDVLDWTAKKFPEFYRALHATLVEASPGLRARLEESFAHPATSLGPYLRPGGVRGVWTDFLAGKTSWSRPWSLYVLNEWCRRQLAA